MPIGTTGVGGRNLGTATGAINIDTSSTEKAAVTVRRVSRDIEQSLGGIGRQNIGQKMSEQFRTAAREAQTFGKQINTLRSEIAAVGVAGAVLSKIGIDGAKNIRNYRVSFRTLLGDEQKATELMRQLTTQANEFGIEVEEVWQLARALLPALEGNVGALDDFVKRAALLASTNPLKGTADAARAIQEYLAGQTVSLQRLFNVDPNLIAEAQAQFKGVGEQLDYILGRMGATEEGAKEMADAWVGVKNELRLALADGFTPLLETIQPLLVQFREWVAQLRQTNPELLKVGAGVAAIAAVGAPALLFFGQLVSSAQKLKTVIDALNISKLTALGPALGFAAAAAGGVGLGIGVTRAIGRATGNENLANANTQQLWTQIKQILFTILAGLSEVVVQVGNLFLTAAERFNQAIVGMLQSVANFANFLGNVIPEELGGGRLKEIGDGLNNLAKGLLETSQGRINDARTRLESGQDAFLKNALNFFGLGSSGATSGGGFVGGGIGGDNGAAEREAALKELNDQLQQIEENRLKQVADATEQYTEQRAETIRQYNQTLQRENEDFLRSRKRQEEQFRRDVERINRERIEQEAEWQAELNDRIADLQGETAERIAEVQEDGNKRIADIEEKYYQDRERREREHRLNLLNAASRLDAAAIAEEQRRFRESNRTADDEFKDRVESEKESLQERLEQEKENLQERIQQEQEAHEERIQEARAADAKRIADMRQSLSEQQRLEDEDRAIRLQRMREDHNQQLQAQAEQHQKRLAQIAEQAAQERALLQAQFNDKLEMLADQYKKENQITAVNTTPKTIAGITGGSTGNQSLDDWWKRFTQNMPGYSAGGSVTGTGMAMLHGSRSRPEYVLSPDTTAALRGMLGNFNQAGLVGAVAGGRNVTLNIQSGAFQIQGAPGQSGGDIQGQVYAALTQFFESVAA